MGDGEGESPKTLRPTGGDPRRRPKLLAAYAAFGLVALGVLIAIMVLSSGASFNEKGDPHINLASGSTNGVPPERRIGIEPPPLPSMNLNEAARAADCELSLRLPDEGHDHLRPDSPEPDYRTIPPTSGPHIEDPYQQADGAYSKIPKPSAVVHSLEHGRLAIQYKPQLPEVEQRELLGLYSTMHNGALLFPHHRMPYEVAAATWTNLLTCIEYRGASTLAALQSFGRATWGRYGNEPVTGLDPNAPTPARPDR